MVCYDRTIFGRDTTIWKTGIWGCKKITFKVAQMKFLAMNITIKTLSFDSDIYSRKCTKYLHETWSLLNHFFYNFDPYNVFLAIATNIPQRLKTPGSHFKFFIAQTFLMKHTYTYTHTRLVFYGLRGHTL